MAENIYPYNYISIFLYLQGYGIFRFLWTHFKDFVEQNSKQIYFRSAQKRFAPHLEYPSLVVVWDGLDEDEDVGVWSYLPMRSFISEPRTIDIGYEVYAQIKDEPATRETLIGTHTQTLSGLLCFPNLPVPEGFFNFFTTSGGEQVKYAWATNQYISSKWRIEYISKVVDPFKSGYSTWDFLSQMKGYFPFQKFHKVGIKEVAVPMVGDKTKAMKLSFEEDNYFMLRLNSAVDTESIYEAGTDDRKLQVTISAETRQHVLSYWKENS